MTRWSCGEGIRNEAKPQLSLPNGKIMQNAELLGLTPIVGPPTTASGGPPLLLKQEGMASHNATLYKSTL